MGFYPVCPGSGQYVLGAPYFKKMTLHLENGKDVVISADRNSDENRFVQALNVAGKEYTLNYINHTDLTQGMNLDFQMGAAPNEKRGTSAESAPYSFSKEYVAKDSKKRNKKK